MTGSADLPACFVRSCDPQTRRECEAWLDQSKACWRHENTLSKRLLGIDTCFTCEVFKRYANVRKGSFAQEVE